MIYISKVKGIDIKMKVAIITGANGFVGHYLVHQLLMQNYYIVAIVRNTNSNVNNINRLKNVLIVYCDMKDVELLVDKIKINTKGSIFYHLAWEGSSGLARADHILQIDNVKYTTQAAIVAKRLGCKRFIVAGSVVQLMYKDYLSKNEIKPEAITCYAVGKIAAENMIKCICPNINLEYCWTYIANFYGVDDTTDNFINFLINKYNKKEVPILTSAEQMADFTYVTDIANALYLVGEKGNANHSYYIGYGEPKPLKYYVELIHKKLAPEIDSGIGRKPFLGINLDFQIIDYLKLHKDTGFRPKVGFEEGIDKILSTK